MDNPGYAGRDHAQPLGMGRHLRNMHRHPNDLVPRMLRIQRVQNMQAATPGRVPSVPRRASGPDPMVKRLAALAGPLLALTIVSACVMVIASAWTLR